MTLNDWTLKGVFPEDYESLAYSFYGRRGVTPNGYSPYPSGTIRTDTTAVTTPGTCNMECHAVNTYGYQWENSRDNVNWNEMAGETIQELTEYYAHKAGISGDHYYRCICKGYLGDYTTNPVKITVNYHIPEITISADKTVITAPDSITFTATATYTTSYQWQKDGEDIPGATSEKLIASFDYGDSGIYDYTCKATGLGGTITSTQITVMVSEPEPIITIAPAEVTILQGETTTLTATATYAESFKWYKQSGSLWEEVGSGESYTTEASMVPSIDVYHCLATGLGGTTTSNDATVTILPLTPTVEIAADKTEITEGESVTFTATYTPVTSTLSLQQLTGESWIEIGSTAEETVTLSTPGTEKFRYVANNFGVETISNEVEITVKEPEETKEE